MPQVTILSSLQIKILLAYMDQHRELAIFKPNGLNIKKEHNRLWDELATQMNAAGKTKRSGAAWRRFWAEKKYNARRKITEIITAQKHGKRARTSLKEIDYKILSLLNLPTKWEPSDDSIVSEDYSLTGPSDPFVDSDKTRKEINRQTPIQMEIKPLISNHDQYDANETFVQVEPELDISHTHDGTPQWAVDIEERRAAATERIATSLEKLTTAVIGMHDSLSALSTDVATIKNILVSRPP